MLNLNSRYLLKQFSLLVGDAGSAVSLNVVPLSVFGTPTSSSDQVRRCIEQCTQFCRLLVWRKSVKCNEVLFGCGSSNDRILHVKFVDIMEPAIYNHEFYDTLFYVTKFCGHQ